MATRLIFDCDRCGERGIPGPGIPFRVSRDNEADEFERIDLCDCCALDTLIYVSAALPMDGELGRVVSAWVKATPKDLKDD